MTPTTGMSAAWFFARWLLVRALRRRAVEHLARRLGLSRRQAVAVAARVP